MLRWVARHGMTLKIEVAPTAAGRKKRCASPVRQNTHPHAGGFMVARFCRTCSFCEGAIQGDSAFLGPLYIMLYADPKQPCTFDVRLIDRTTVNIARKKHGDNLKSAEVRPGKESAHCVGKEVLKDDVGGCVFGLLGLKFLHCLRMLRITRFFLPEVDPSPTNLRKRGTMEESLGAMISCRYNRAQ